MDQETLREFLEKNELSKASQTLYHTHYKVGDYKYDSRQKKHRLSITSTFHNNQVNYELEKTGDLECLDPELVKCLENKEEVVSLSSYL